ncbi:MAG TPA: PHB depolymerase family esterase [Fimbriiglobus sp.]|nr:PHB depolymerase family esterase [Fimbriiglobus sp.]
MTTAPRIVRRARLIAACVGLVATGVVAGAADVVIMADGFTIQGRWFKETELASDPGTGAVRIAKQGGFDVIDDGPRYIIFSRHARKGGKLEEDAAKRDYPAYKTKTSPLKAQPLPLGRIKEKTDFDAKWRRRLTFDIPPNPKSPAGGYEYVRQQVAHLDPHFMMTVSTDHIWQYGSLTAEEDPLLILKLLRMHPELADPKGKVDPMRRMNIAAFFKDIASLVNLRRRENDWLTIARQELARLKKDAPGDWGKEANDRFAELSEEIDRVEARITIDSVEAAVAAGRYEAAGTFLANFSPKAIDPKDKTRVAVLRAQIEEVQPRYERTRRLLTDLIERVGGMRDAQLYAAVAGGPGLMYAPRPKMTPETATLLTAAGAVRAELHPDTAPRLDIFQLTAQQAEKDRKAGREPRETPTELLAFAVTGWVKGKNAADKSAPAALRAWATREMALGYLRADTAIDRAALLDTYLRSGRALEPEELAQLISLLPPPTPEDLKKRAGVPVPAAAAAGAEGVYQYNTGTLPGLPNGVDYYLHLPPEYHHGRPHPLLIALTGPQLPPEQLVGVLAQYADRFGYVVAAPKWANQFNVKPYDYSGDDHPLVTATLRDVLRHFQVDADKVFLYGFADGANFALDVGMAMPDLFAGVVANNPDPPTNIFLQYWHNAQKLPVYTVIGELTGSFKDLRKLYERWMTSGFPALLTVYKGRGKELFPLEMPRIFDWMGRKTRVRGAASLRLNQPGFEPWQVLRESDDRFYWVGVADDGLRNGNRVKGWQNRAVSPAQFRADIGKNGVITIDRAIGINKFVVWLERDLIDWSKPVVVNVNGHRPREYTPRKLDPNLHLMMEELYRTGDRKMLYLGKLIINGDG